MFARRAIVIALVLAGACAPFVVNPYYLSFLLQLCMMIALAQAWNLLSGMTGYVSFGHSAFFGVGAYTGALLLTAGWPAPVAIAAGAGLALLLALPLGLLTLRLRGPYFAIAMLGLNEIGRLVATLWTDVTNGGAGVSLLPKFLPSLTGNYFAMLLLAIIATVLVGRVYHSRFGLELRAIREDEDAAEMVGVNTIRDKVAAFVLSAIVPGAVGAVAAMYTSYINPSSAFSPALNIEMIVMVLLGGTGSVWGPVIGAALIVSLHEALWAEFPAAHLILLGAVLIVVILFLPRGIVSVVRARRRVRPEAAERGTT